MKTRTLILLAVMALLVGAAASQTPTMTRSRAHDCTGDGTGMHDGAGPHGDGSGDCDGDGPHGDGGGSGHHGDGDCDGDGSGHHGDGDCDGDGPHGHGDGDCDGDGPHHDDGDRIRDRARDGSGDCPAATKVQQKAKVKAGFSPRKSSASPKAGNSSIKNKAAHPCGGCPKAKAGCGK